MTGRKLVARQQWLALGLAFTAQLSNSLAFQAMAPLAPLFQPELALSKAEVGLFSTAIFAGTWGILIVAGSLTDRLGARRLMSLGQAATGLLLGTMVAVGSFFQVALVLFATGLGRGLVAPATAKAVMEWFPPRTRATAMGVQQTAVPMAGIATAAMLPALGLAIGWRYAVGGVGLLIIAFGLLTAALYRDAPQPDPPPTSRFSSRAGFGKLIRDRRLWAISGIGLLMAGAQVALTTYLALYFQEEVLALHIPDYGARAVVAGGYLALCQVGGVFSRVLWGVLSDRIFRGRRILVLAVTTSLASLASLVVADLGPHYSLALLAPIIFAFGAAAIGWAGLYMTAAAELAGPKDAGTAIGLSMAIMQVGMVVGPPFFGYVADVSGSYRNAWLGLAGLFGCVCLLSIATARSESPMAQESFSAGRSDRKR